MLPRLGARNFLFVVVTPTGSTVWVKRASPAASVGCDRRSAELPRHPHRHGSVPRRAHLAGAFPRRLLPGAAYPHVGDVGHRHRPVGHQGQGAQRADLRAARRAGGDKVVCYPHNRGEVDNVQTLVDSCLETKEQGWKFVRWGLPNDGQILEPRQAVRQTIKQFQAVREAVGEDIEICFDVHTRLDLPEAVWLCQEVEQFSPFFIEDPLRCENPDSFKTLRPRTRVPLAAGEQFSSKWEFRQLIEEEWIDYARIDLCIVGGFTEARKITGWSETHYIQLAVHNPLGPVSSAACLQMSLATPLVGVQEQPRATGTVLTDVVPVQPEWRDGYLLAPTRPGLGIEFDREAAKKHPFQQRELPTLRRLDGSFTNW
ncbi:MAG: mandelate racemase/muconate lactonizing enzyme family protein [Caldilineaceae bacterium]